jgi:hypothetical protein
LLGEADACNPRTQETEAGGSRVLGQPGLLSETLSKKKKKRKKGDRGSGMTETNKRKRKRKRTLWTKVS